MRSHLEPHHVWTTVTVNPNMKDVQRATVKARMITWTCMLQENKVKFYPDQDASCLFCDQESRDTRTLPAAVLTDEPHQTVASPTNAGSCHFRIYRENMGGTLSIYPGLYL